MSLYEIIHYNGSFDMTTSKEEAWLVGGASNVVSIACPYLLNIPTAFYLTLVIFAAIHRPFTSYDTRAVQSSEH